MSIISRCSWASHHYHDRLDPDPTPLDPDALTFIGSAGARELLCCREVVEQLGGTLMISRARENVRQILTLCGPAELLPSQYDRSQTGSIQMLR
ncbi:MAG: hypothetical protein SYR96_29565 [Actinomycetota bacterium]|nr:hypothetical protein [Actinomycetota bacterium]